MLLDSGASVDACNWSGSTPLNVAAKMYNVLCMFVLLDADADLNHVTKEGRTPLADLLRVASVAVQSRTARGSAWSTKPAVPRQRQSAGPPLLRVGSAPA